MTDLKISELPTILSEGIQTGDWLPVVDSSTNTTKKVSAHGRLNTPFSTVTAFADAVTAGYTAPDGTVVSAGPVQFQADSSASVAGLPVGWVPFGDVSPDHRGAIGDDVANDKTSIDASMLLGPIKTLPQTYFYGGAASELSGRFWGDGAVRTTEGKRGRYFAAITQPPSALGNSDSINTAFNGDTSRVQFPVEQRITGASTLGQPVSGYVYTPEAYPHYTFLFNSSGHNESLSTNDGRTGAVAYRTRVLHTGQGDAVAYNADVFVNSQKAGATHWLAQPAGVLLNGTVSAGVDFVYLNVIETGMQDNGHDVSAVGAVFKGTRTQARTAQETYWAGARVQSVGSVEWDEGFIVTGKVRIGLNLSRMESSSNAAIAVAEGHRIYLGASRSGLSNFDTTLGQSYISLEASNFTIRLDNENRLVIPRASSGTLAIESNATVSGILSVTGNLSGSGNINSATQFQVGFTRVVGSRKTGWSPDTGTSKRTANATYAGTAEATYTQATIQTLMDAVRDCTQTQKALKNDLISHGLIGA